MSLTKLAKAAIINELSQCNAAVSAKSVINAVTCKVSGISRNLVQQAVTQLKKDGIVDYIPSTSMNEYHKLSLSSSYKAPVHPSSDIEPIKRKRKSVNHPQTAQESNMNIEYRVINQENGDCVGVANDLAVAQELATKHTITGNTATRIDEVKTTSVATYEPMIIAKLVTQSA